MERLKIGYPCINRTLLCKSNRTFRLKSYSDELLATTVKGNLNCLLQILKYNVEHGIYFFRITSDLIPFASHPICRFDWGAFFRDDFMHVGRFMKLHDIRISMHPDHFVVLNSPNDKIVENSVRELDYHSSVLNLFGLDMSAKIQIHIGGVYGDKNASTRRFSSVFNRLAPPIRERLAVENDDRNYSVSDCLRLFPETGIPVIFDALHHELNNCGETLREALYLCARTWKQDDGLPVVDYSLQESGSRKGKHAEQINNSQFRQFLRATMHRDFDVMLELKDKEKSALIALETAAEDPRLYRPSCSV